MAEGSRNKNVAIIGSGIAGLAAGYYLKHLNCEMYEAKPFLSLAGHGMELDDGKMIDIPLRVIHPEYYPRLFSLCRELGIKLRKLEHSGSFTLSNREDYFEYFSFSFFNKRINFVKPSWNYLKLGVGFLRFYRLSKKYMSDESYEKINFEEFLKRHKVSKITTNLIILPLLSSICTCSYKELKKFPARVLLEMITRIAGPFPMERFLSGTKDVESALKGSLDKIYLDSKVEKVEIHDEYVNVQVNGQSKKYDHVVIATYARINELLYEQKSFRPDRQYQFEVVEKPVVKLPESYKNKSVVVMDGPFMCLDPYKDGLHVLGHVKHAIHYTNTGMYPTVPNEDIIEYLNNGVVKNPKITKIQKFIEAGMEFFEDFDKLEHIGSMFTIRTVLAYRDHDDARPTYVRKEHDTGIQTDKIYTIFSGKIGTCVQAANQLVNMLKGKRNE